MIYQSTQSDDYLWNQILRGKQKEKTRLAGYCASCTECSDHSLRKIEKMFFFRISAVFFLLSVIKRSEKKLGMLDSHLKKFLCGIQFLKKIDWKK